MSKRLKLVYPFSVIEWVRQKGVLPTIPKDLIDDHETDTIRKLKKKEKNFSFSPFLLQTNTYLSSATVGLLSLLSVTANLQTIHETFTKTHESIRKSNFATHPRYTVIIREF